MAVDWSETYCGKGHRHESWKMSLHWTPCACATAIGGGHHGVYCWIPDENGKPCGDFTVPGCVDRSREKHWRPAPQNS